MNDGERRSALVTGASYGVGAATALALARAGFDVAITATTVDNLAGTMKTLEAAGARVVPVALDLRDDASIAGAFAAAVAGAGPLDILVNNAGSVLRRRATEVTQDEWKSVMSVNVRGAFFLTQQFGRRLIADKRGGCVVNIASTHGLVGAVECSTYGISKAAILHMTKMLAVEWAEHAIRVNAVAPGRLNTSSPARAETGSDPAYMAAMLQRIPLHRLATPEQVAAAVCWLASPAAASVTGHTLVIDGGLTSA